jgi:histidinol-phosphate aminotransferase
MADTFDPAAEAPTMIGLSGNTAPLGPSPKVIAAIRSVAQEAHLYPERQSDGLAEAIGIYEDVPSALVAPTAGSAGAIMDLFRTVASGGGEVVAFQHAFHLFRSAAETAGARYVSVPVGRSFERDVEAFLDHIGDSTSLAIIDNPPNPTSDSLSGEELRHLLKTIPHTTTVVLDEAYSHFAVGSEGYESGVDMLDLHPRVVVTRSMSKAFALAGMRVGYAIGPEDLIAEIRRNRIPFSINRAAEAAAHAALSDRDHMEANIAATIEAKRRMTDGLRELDVRVLETLANFILVGTEDKVRAVSEFRERGISVNGLGLYEIPEFLRVSAGTGDDVSAFLAASAEILART